MVAPAIDAPWIVGRPTEAPAWAFDIGPFAGTPTTFDTLESQPGHRLYVTGRIVPSTAHDWAVGELITSVGPLAATIRPVGTSWVRYFDFRNSTPTTLETVPEQYAMAFTPGVFGALRALTLHRTSPWARFLVGFDPVPALGTTTIAPQVALAPDAHKSTADDSDELGAVEDLRRWLDITYEQVAAATSIGLRTVHHWKHAGAKPRPRTVRTLWRLHSLVYSIGRVLGPEDALRWFRLGDPSPRDLIVAGRLSEAETQARPVLFAEPLGERRFSGLIGSEETRATASPRVRSLARATRRPKVGPFRAPT
jgi:hypothetical protein